MADTDTNWDEWESALDDEYGETPEVDEAPEEDAPDEPEQPEAPDEPEQPEEPEEPEEQPNAPDEPEAPEGEEPEEPPVPEPQPKEEPAELPSTREEIKAALRELGMEEQTYKSEISSLKDEVLSAIYPEGIDRQLRDADGDPINGLQDLTGVDPQTGRQVSGGLINPVTNEVFTEEEAARFILRKQNELNEQVTQMEEQAYQIAEVQMSLKEGSERVEKEFGPILDRLPAEITKRIADAYIATLHRDPKSGIVVGAPLDAYEFYSIALAGARPLLDAQPSQPPKQPDPTPPAAPADKGDRADLGQRGTPKKLSKEESEWEDAFNEVL